MTQDPNHPITVSRHPMRVQALFGGHLLADSGDVLVLKEADYDPVFYFPRKDIEMSVLQNSDHHTHCPHKGEASYLTIMRDGTIVDNFAWSYPAPLPGRADIANRVAFYPQYVDFRVTDIPANAAAEPAAFENDDTVQRANSADPGPPPEESVDEIVLHTDSGAGFSQEAAWEPTVSEPVYPDPDKPYSGAGSI